MEEGKYFFVHNQRTQKKKSQKDVCENFFVDIAKYLKDNIHNSLYFVQKYACLFVLGHHLFVKAHIFPLAPWRGEIMSVDKYPCIFLHQMEDIVPELVDFVLTR